MMVHCARLQCGNMKVMCLNSSGGKSTSPFPDTPFSRVRLPFSLREAAGLQTHRMVQAVPPEKRACFPKKAAFQLCVSAASRELAGSLTNVEGLRFAIVVGQFNEFVTRPLLAGALGTFKKHLVKDSDIDIVWVPGAFEIPVTAQAIAKSGKYHAVLCIGTVIRGETTHYDAVANAAASGVLSASLNSGVPCIFGVLTCENLEQALHRAGGKAGNKGAEAAVTAMEMASLFYHQLPTLK